MTVPLRAIIVVTTILLVAASLAFVASRVPAIALATPPRGYCDQLDTLDRYACLVEQAGIGAGGDDRLKRQTYTVLAAMQTIQTMASSARYSHLATIEGFAPPPSNQQAVCLDAGFGICGNHMLLFDQIMDRIGIPARRVEFYFADPVSGKRASHAAAEALINGKWRFVDVTWGSIWLLDANDATTMLSIEEILAGNGTRLTAEIDPWFASVAATGYDPFIYMKAGADLVVGGNGTVRLPRHGRQVDFSNVPNYVGDNDRRNVAHQNLEFLLPLHGEIELTITGSSCSSQQLMVGDSVVPATRGRHTVTVDRDRDAEIRILGHEPCYVVFSSITQL